MPHYPGSTSRPVSSHGGPASSHMGLVVHITTNDYDPYGFFSNPANQASSNYWVAADGAVSEYVNPDLSAWAQANGNGSFVSVEVSGKVGTPMTDAQVTAVAALYAWGHATYGWPLQLTNSPGTSGLGWHGMGGAGWGGHSSCPGPVRVAQLPLVLARAVAPIALEDIDMYTLEQIGTAAADATLSRQIGGAGTPNVQQAVTGLFQSAVKMEASAARADASFAALTTTIGVLAAALTASEATPGTVDATQITASVLAAVDAALAKISITLTSAPVPAPTPTPVPTA